MDNPLDDDLLKELGLEPREKAPAPAPQAPKPKAARPPVPPAASEPMESAPAPAGRENLGSSIKDLAQDMPLQVVAVLGKKTMTLKEIVSLKPGEVIDLKKLPQEMVDIVANGRLVARAELVLVDGRLGLQIKQLA